LFGVNHDAESKPQSFSFTDIHGQWATLALFSLGTVVGFNIKVIRLYFSIAAVKESAFEGAFTLAPQPDSGCWITLAM
jgi:hypothetical protein